MNDVPYPGQSGPPEFGQQPPPPSGYPPPSGGYPSPEYAPPPASYPPPQYGWGDPQYPTGPYPTGPYAPPPPGPPATTTGGGHKGRWISLAVAVLAALGVGGYFLFSGGSAGASTPAAAVRTLLDAGERDDVAAAQSVLCAADRNDAVLAGLRSAGRISSYTILSVDKTDSSHAIVRARVSAAATPTPVVFSTPVVKEGGSWKACPTFASIGGGGPVLVPSGAPSISIPSVSLPSGFPSVSIPSISLPALPPATGGFNPCSLTSGDRTQVATTYVGLAEIGETNFAQSCVYHDAVPRSVTAGLRAATSGAYFAPTGTTNGSTIRFASIDGSTHLSVTVTREPDGKDYVTKVEKD